METVKMPAARSVDVGWLVQALDERVPVELRPVVLGILQTATRLLRQKMRRAPVERPPDGLMSLAEAAAYLGLSLTTFRDQVLPEVPHVKSKNGRRVLYEKKDLERWRNTHKVGDFGSTHGPSSTSSGSATIAAASKSPRAQEILRRLQPRPPKSTATSFRVVK